MLVDFKSLSVSQKYHLMIQSIIPRPIAWTLTRNENQTFNLAPFSYFNAICSEPPLVMTSIGYKKNGEKKDTRRNIEREGECVIHIASSEHAQVMTDSAAEYPAEESEVTALGLQLDFTFGENRLPRLALSRLALYCRLYQIQEIGQRKQGLVFCEIVSAFYADAVVSQNLHRLAVNAQGVDPLGRLGGDDYTTFGEIVTVGRE